MGMFDHFAQHLVQAFVFEGVMAVRVAHFPNPRESAWVNDVSKWSDVKHNVEKRQSVNTDEINSSMKAVPDYAYTQVEC